MMWLIFGALGCVIIGLLIRLGFMRGAARKLARDLARRREMDTNTLLDLSTQIGRAHV